VVVLNTGLQLDDHRDSASSNAARLYTIDHLVEPSNNLAIQTQVIAGARAFVGTYGGLSYLPPFLGVNSIAFYSDPTEVAPHHLYLAQSVFHDLGTARLSALDVRDLTVLRSVGLDWRAGVRV
jgi:hypothetical protein